MKRNLLSAALTCGLLFMLLAGCGGGSKDAAPTAAAPGAQPAAASPEASPAPSSPAGNPGEGSDGGGPRAALVPPAGPLAAHARGLSIVRPEHFAVIKADLAKARKAKIVQDVPEEIARQATAGLPRHLKGELDTVAEKVDLMWIAIGPSGQGTSDMPVTVAIYARAVSPAALNEFLSSTAPPTDATIDYNGKQYKRVAEDDGDATYYWHEGAEFFLTMDEATIKQTIDAGGKIAESPVLEKLAHSKLDADFVVAGSLGPLKQAASEALTGMLMELRLPIPLHQTAGPLPAQIDWATIAFDLEAPNLIDIQADMDSPEAAETFKTTIAGLVSLGSIKLQQLEQEAPDDPAVKEVFAIAKKLLAAVKVEASGQNFNASLAHLPELDALPQSLAAAASARPKADDLQNGRWIALGALNHEDATRRLPANIKDAEGNDLLSWRVAILPFMEETILFQQLDRKAAWDSDANRELLDIEMHAYTTSFVEDARLTTWKLVPGAPGGIMLVCTGEGTEVPWSKPDNFAIDPADPLAALGPEPEGGYVVAMRDARMMRMPLDALLDALGVEDSPTPEPEPDPTPDPTAAPGRDSASAPAAPADDAPTPRTWTDATGKFKVEAVLVEISGDTVTLRRTDNGNAVRLPIDKLSAADQEHLESLTPRP